jgi:Golgi phosphoprotein 3 GPP34
VRPAPTSLAARLFLLSYDVDHDRFVRYTELGTLVRAGALTDLFLTGHLVDDGGRAKVDEHRHAQVRGRNSGASVGSGAGTNHGGGGKGTNAGSDPAGDPVLAALLDEIAQSRPRKWKHWVGKGGRATKRAVRDQLAVDGWIRVEQRRVLGVVPLDRVVVKEKTAVVRLQREAGRVLRGSVSLSQVEKADAALVALAAKGELRTFAGRRDRRAHRQRIAEAAVATGPIAAALRSVIQDHAHAAGAA